MENMSFVAADEEFQFDGSPYIFEPEYTDEELQDMERRQREEQLEEANLMASTRSTETWWCSRKSCESMPSEQESFCCKEWDLIQSGQEGSWDSACVTSADDFPNLIHSAVLETFFLYQK